MFVSVDSVVISFGEEFCNNGLVNCFLVCRYICHGHGVWVCLCVSSVVYVVERDLLHKSWLAVLWVAWVLCFLLEL